MKNNKFSEKLGEIFEQSHEEHRVAQQKRFARETTAEDRLKWLEDTLIFLQKAGIDYIGNKHKIASRK